MFTKIDYMYRDPDNYKFHGDFVVEGKIESFELMQYLFDREWFVPEKIGLPHLLTDPTKHSDHLLHELTSFEECKEQPTFCSAEELIKLFKKNYTFGWF